MHTHRATTLRRQSRPAMSCSGIKPDVEDMPTVGDVSTSATGKARNNEQPQRTWPTHSDTSFSFWFTTSSLVAPASTASAATAGTAAAKDLLCIHHGAIDQTTIMTPPAPVVRQRTCQVLEELGMESKAESEYKYRYVRRGRRLAGQWSSGSVVCLVRMGWRRLR